MGRGLLCPAPGYNSLMLLRDENGRVMGGKLERAWLADSVLESIKFSVFLPTLKDLKPLGKLND